MTFEEYMSDQLGGKGSDNAATLGATDPNKYLRNRLWHAFEAGVKSGETDRRLQQTIEWYQVALKKLQTENRELRKKIKEIDSVK